MPEENTVTFLRYQREENVSQGMKCGFISSKMTFTCESREKSLLMYKKLMEYCSHELFHKEFY